MKIVGFTGGMSPRVWVLLALAGPLAFLSVPAGADIAGYARVVDGDTLVIADIRVRLHGIDSPEQRQTCLLYGAVSYTHLRAHETDS